MAANSIKFVTTMIALISFNVGISANLVAMIIVEQQ